MAQNSLCQSKVERFIGTISRSILKLQTASPTSSFDTLVAEARIQYNNTNTPNLQGRSPSDLHFTRSNANLMAVDGSVPLTGLTGDVDTAEEVLKAKKEAQNMVLNNDVRRYLQRREKENPGDRDDRIKVDDFCFKKRTSFWPGAPRKLQFKVDEDAFQVVSKIATNSFKCLSLINNNTVILPGDQLVKTRLPRDDLVGLILKMQAFRGSRTRSGPPSTRSRTAAAVPDNRWEDITADSITRVFS